MVRCDLNLKHLNQIMAKRLTMLTKKSFKMVISYLYVQVMLFFYTFTIRTQKANFYTANLQVMS